MHEKVFSEGDKFPAAKFNAAKKKLRRKFHAANIPVLYFSSGEIGHDENIMHQNLTR